MQNKSISFEILRCYNSAPKAVSPSTPKERGAIGEEKMEKDFWSGIITEKTKGCSPVFLKKPPTNRNLKHLCVL
jgi:hypothetical protein